MRPVEPCILCGRTYRNSHCRECGAPKVKPVVLTNTRKGLVCHECYRLVSGDIENRNSIYAIHQGRNPYGIDD